MSANALRIAGAVLTVVIVWALVLGWWQSNDHQPHTEELALYLLALPLALVGGYWLIRLSINQIKAKPESGTNAPAPVADADPLALARAKTAAAERVFSLPVIETFVVAAGGRSAEDILAAVEAGKRPEPIPELLDADGFPVFAVPAGELDLAPADELFAESTPGLRKLLEREDALRSLWLLEQVLQPACDRVAQLVESAKSYPGKMNLQVVCLIPATWQENHSANLQPWLHSFDWPSDEIADVHFQIVPITSDTETMRLIDTAVLDANREPDGSRLLVLVAGAMSAVTRDSVAEREATLGLFSSQDQERTIPGEGAAAILFAPEAACTRLSLTECVTVSRVGHAVRDKPLHAGGRIRGTLIGELIADLLQVSNVAAEDVKAAVIDTDHRSTHLIEMLEGIDTSLSHLDPLKDCPATGTVTGCLTPLGGLFALACACHRTLADQAPTLCLCNQHDRERAALLVRPVNYSPESEPSTPT